MTETLIRPAAVRSHAGRLRAVLLVDGLGTAAVGVAALALAEPLAEHLASAGALQAVGVFFVVGGLDMVCVAGLALLDTTALGTGIVLTVVATCLSMGTAKLALARRLA